MLKHLQSDDKKAWEITQHTKSTNERVYAYMTGSITLHCFQITIDHDVNKTIASCNSTCTPQRDGDVLDYCCQTELCNDDENKMFETTTITAPHTPTTTPYGSGAARKNLELFLTGFMLLMVKVILFQ